MSGSQRGRQRERDVRKILEGEGWWVVKAGGSFGEADLIALRAGDTSRLIEVKSTAGGPYERFGPDKRRELIYAALKAGARPELAYWPPRGKLEFLLTRDWPS